MADQIQPEDQLHGSDAHAQHPEETSSDAVPPRDVLIAPEPSQDEPGDSAAPDDAQEPDQDPQPQVAPVDATGDDTQPDPDPAAGDDAGQPEDELADPQDVAAARAARRRRRLGVLVVIGLIVMIILLLLRACTPGAEVVTVVAAGDMACDPIDPLHREPETATTTDGQPPDNPLWCREKDVSDIAVSVAPQAVLGLGDYQYEVPSAKAFAQYYGPTWGRLKEITIPAIGNQEYKVHKANTFTAYFADQTGPEEHYWSTKLGAWHIVVLNSNCTIVLGGCGEGSPQQKWLAADLAANRTRCTAAIWHHPRWSNGIAGPDTRTNALYQTLAEYHVDILLSGHEADYERFGPLDGDGHPSQDGVRQFVVGTGGQVVYDPSGEPDRQATAHNQTEAIAADAVTYPSSEFVDFSHPGVLVLTLRPDSYDWAFRGVNVAIDEANNQVLDSGSAKCVQ